MGLAIFFVSLLFLGGWYLMHKYIPYDTIEKPYVALGLKGLSGAVLSIFISTVLALIISYNPWFAPPATNEAIGTISWDDSRIYLCMALILGLNMMGIPIGFLTAMAQAKRSEGIQEANAAAARPSRRRNNQDWDIALEPANLNAPKQWDVPVSTGQHHASAKKSGKRDFASYMDNPGDYNE